MPQNYRDNRHDIHYNGHFPRQLRQVSTIVDFTATKDDGGGGGNYSYKTCKSPVKSSPPTNQHPASYRPDVLPVAQPTVSEH